MLTPILLAGLIGASDPSAPSLTPSRSAEPDWISEPIKVGAGRKGPALWRVSKGEDEVWVLGATAPLTRNDWDAQAVEKAVAASRVVYTPPVAALGLVTGLRILVGGEYKIPGGKTLDQATTPALAARVRTTAARVGLKDADINRLRPSWAAFLLPMRAFDHEHWVRPVDKVEALARKHHVKVQPIARYDARPVLDGLDALSPDKSAECLAMAVDDVDFDLAHVEAGTAAFAQGDLAGLRRHYRYENAFNCLTAAPQLEVLLQRSLKDGADNIERALSKKEHAFFILSVSSLARKDGVLEILRARGYRVEEPEG
jgi:hypothetical protein